MGGAVSAGVDNDDLIDKLKGDDYIRSPNVEKVFRLVDRADYIVLEDKRTAYKDSAWRSGNLHLSAPCIYAQAMEGLQLGEGMSFLNIGSGTGYLSTMAGLLLGPKGISHGVELHGDVIEYAYQRLDRFKTDSGALDVAEFCDPVFIQGNAFCLPDDKPLYDRVYCGAACFDTHERFMKQLLKVNGILVMPLNDQLLKVTRTGEEEWHSESLLPVTFSPLVIPDPTHPPATLKIPASAFVSLQDLCRRNIRRILHQLVEEENPDLKDSFIHKVESSQRNSSNELSGMRMLLSGISSDHEEDSDELEDPPFESHRQVVNHILELRRNLNLRRNVNHSATIRRFRRHPTQDREELSRSGDDDAQMSDGTKSNDRLPHSTDNQDIESDQGLENSLSDDEEYASCKDMDFTPSKEMHTTTTSLNNTEKQDSTSLKSKNKTTLKCDESKSSPSDVKNKMTSNQISCPQNSTQSEPSENLEVLVASSIPSVAITPPKQPFDEDECLSTHSSSSNSSNKRSREGDTEPKKREKFDSGVGDELEGEPTTTPGDSTEGDDKEAESDDSNSGQGQHIPVLSFFNPRQRKYCAAGQYIRRKKAPQPRTKEEDETTDERKESPVKKYSCLMQAKILLLPLPLSMKAYINNNRAI